MIDGNAIFDEEGEADLGKAAFVKRRPDGQYYIYVQAILTQDELYNLGLVLARLADVPKGEQG